MNKKVYQKEVSSYNLQQCERMFDILNHNLFNDEIRAQIRYNNKRRYLNRVGVDQNLVYSHDLRYAIEIPEGLIYKNSDQVPVWMLTQMIIIYSILHEIKATSNRNIYKNKHFKALSDNFGLICKWRGESYGYEPIQLSQQVNKLIEDIQFEKLPVYSETERKTKSCSTHKYVFKKESIRATKPNHILYCITGQSFETICKVDDFMKSLGLNRMKMVY